MSASINAQIIDILTINDYLLSKMQDIANQIYQISEKNELSSDDLSLLDALLEQQKQIEKNIDENLITLQSLNDLYIENSETWLNIDSLIVKNCLFTKNTLSSYYPRNTTINFLITVQNNGLLNWTVDQNVRLKFQIFSEDINLINEQEYFLMNGEIITLGESKDFYIITQTPSVIGRYLFKFYMTDSSNVEFFQPLVVTVMII